MVQSPTCVLPAAAVAQTTTTQDEALSAVLAIGVAELLRPHRHSKHALRHPQTSGHNYSNDQPKAKYTNWMNPMLWVMIHAAAVAEGYPWSAAAIAKHLKLQNPELFAGLHPQHISSWRDLTIKDRLVWKPRVLTSVEHGNHPGGACVCQSILVRV